MVAVGFRCQREEEEQVWCNSFEVGPGVWTGRILLIYIDLHTSTHFWFVRMLWLSTWRGWSSYPCMGVSHWNVWYKLRLRLVLKERWEWHGMTRSYFRKPTRLELMAHGTPSLYWVLQVEVIRLLTEAGAEMERPTGGRFQRGLAHSVGWLLEVSMKLGYVS